MYHIVTYVRRLSLSYVVRCVCFSIGAMLTKNCLFNVSMFAFNANTVNTKCVRARVNYALCVCEFTCILPVYICVEVQPHMRLVFEL